MIELVKECCQKNEYLGKIEYEYDGKKKNVGLWSKSFTCLVKKIHLCDDPYKHTDKSKELFICTSNLKIHLAIRASSTETAAPALT